MILVFAKQSMQSKACKATTKLQMRATITTSSMKKNHKNNDNCDDNNVDDDAKQTIPNSLVQVAQHLKDTFLSDFVTA